MGETRTLRGSDLSFTTTGGILSGGGRSFVSYAGGGVLGMGGLSKIDSANIAGGFSKIDFGIMKAFGVASFTSPPVPSSLTPGFETNASGARASSTGASWLTSTALFVV
jgi:hypothetical protein